MKDSDKTRAASKASLINHIDAVLPQTQCGRCGHPGCRPYAEAIASGEPINRCPPGGEDTIAALARLLDVPALPLDSSYGEHIPRQVAFIREAECIGCTKCIQACPTDAILGAGRQMHTVIEPECTGCELCIDPCPVDCIDMIEPSRISPDASWPPFSEIAQTPPINISEERSQADYWRWRYDFRNQRLQQEARELEGKRQRRLREKLQTDTAVAASGTTAKTTMKSREQLQQEIRDAVLRARARKRELGRPGQDKGNQDEGK